jgi:hypothetical protein
VHAIAQSSKGRQDAARNVHGHAPQSRFGARCRFDGRQRDDNAGRAGHVTTNRHAQSRCDSFEGSIVCISDDAPFARPQPVRVETQR